MIESFRKIFQFFIGVKENSSSERRKRSLEVDDDTTMVFPKMRKTDRSPYKQLSTLEFLHPSPRMMDSRETLLDDISSIRSKRFTNSCRNSSKENISQENDSECIIVSDEDDWAPGRPISRTSLKMKDSKNLAAKKKADSGNDNSLAKGESDDIKVIKTVKPTGDVLFRFSTPAEKLAEVHRHFLPSSKKSFLKKRSFPSVRKKNGIQSLDESIRLDEKMRYSLLLKEQCSRSSNFGGTIHSSSAKKGAELEKHILSKKKPVVPVVDLTEDNPESQGDSKKDKVEIKSISGDDDLEIIAEKYTPIKSHTNTKMKSPSFGTDWLSELTGPYNYMNRERIRHLEEKKIKAELYSVNTKKICAEILEEKIRNHMKITEVILDEEVILEDAEEELDLPKLTPAIEKKVAAALRTEPQSEVLVQAFGLNITRHDIHTLAGTNWLNDEVINFYMNLLIERGKKKEYPSVYAFNTFFYPKLQSSGYSSLRRWTRKVDIFAHDIVIVPVHLGVHWCMAAIDFRKKNICYYDSMGGNNDCCLHLLWNYLQSESMDKKKQPFCYDGWVKENVKKIPQQMNGSDCGMFSCTYAEFLCRNAKFAFTQSDMPYFRRKMVYEILMKQLML